MGDTARRARGEKFILALFFLSAFIGCHNNKNNQKKCVESINLSVYAEPLSGYIPMPVTITVEIQSPESISDAILDLYYSGSDFPDSETVVNIDGKYTYQEKVTYYYQNSYRPRAILKYYENCENDAWGPFIDAGSKISPQCTLTSGPTFLYLNSGGKYEVTMNTFTGSVTAYEWNIDFGNNGTIDKTYTTQVPYIEMTPRIDFNHLGLNALIPYAYTNNGQRIACPQRGITVALAGVFVLGSENTNTGSKITVPFITGGSVQHASLSSITSPSPATYIAFTLNTGIGVVDITYPDSPSLSGLILESYCYKNINQEIICGNYDSLKKVFFDPLTYSCIYAGVFNSSNQTMNPLRAYTFNNPQGLSRYTNFAEFSYVNDFDVYYNNSISKTVILACNTKNQLLVFNSTCYPGGISLGQSANYTLSLTYQCKLISYTDGMTERIYLLSSQTDKKAIKRCNFKWGSPPSLTCSEVYNNFSSTENFLSLDSKYSAPYTYIALLKSDYTLQYFVDRGTSVVEMVTGITQPNSCSSSSSPTPEVKFSGNYLFVRSDGFYVYSLTDPADPQLITQQCGSFPGAMSDGENLYLIQSSNLNVVDFPIYLSSLTSNIKSVYNLSPSSGSFEYYGNKMLIASRYHGILELDASGVFSGGSYVTFSKTYDLRGDKTSTITYSDIATDGGGKFYIATSEGIKEFYPDTGTYFTLISGNFKMVRAEGNYIATSNVNEVKLWNYNNPSTYICYSSQNASAIDIHNGYVFAGGGSTVKIFGESNCPQPKTISLNNFGVTSIKGLQIKGNYLFIIAESDNPLFIYDISDPLNPQFISRGSLGNDHIYGCCVNGISVEDSGKLIATGINPKEATSNIESGFSLFRTLTPSSPEYAGTGQGVGGGAAKDISVLRRVIGGYKFLLTLMNDWVYFYKIGDIE